MNTLEFDAVIIGSGLAGMTAALDLVTKGGKNKVALVTKATLGNGAASAWAQGGVAVALPSDDRPELHAQDTVKVGVGLNHAQEVQILTQEGPQCVLDLVDRGANFDRDADGQFQFAREAAHCRRRVLHAKDATGAEMVRALVASVRALPDSIQVFEETFAHRLEVSERRVAGVVVSGPAGTMFLRTPAVVLASGGAGQLYAYTTNPKEATADGLALAYRAGARLRDLEFVQFHPTALECPVEGGSLPLITEALRGEGAKLVDENGTRFVDELLPRDQVARALWSHRRDGHSTFLDATHLGDTFAEHFPTVYASCRKVGIDPGHQLIPVVPAAHYHMGGIEVDLWGRTSLAGLWACGEVASTGVHGANRLASNSLLEALVFGSRVAHDIAAQGEVACPPVPKLEEPLLWRSNEVGTLVAGRVREIMWERVGLARHGAGLSGALEQLRRLRKRLTSQTGEAANLLTVAELVTLSALARTESRGAHHRLDYPETKTDWAVHLVVEKGSDKPQAVALPAGELELVS